MHTTDGGEAEGVLRSIQHRDAKLSVRFRYGDLEVLVVEIGARGSLTEPALWDGPAWHLLIEGQAVFETRGQARELLPDESLSTGGTAPYTIVNPGDARVKLVSILVGDAGKLEKEAVA